MIVVVNETNDEINDDREEVERIHGINEKINAVQSALSFNKFQLWLQRVSKLKREHIKVRGDETKCPIGTYLLEDARIDGVAISNDRVEEIDHSIVYFSDGCRGKSALATTMPYWIKEFVERIDKMPNPITAEIALDILYDIERNEYDLEDIDYELEYVD